MVTNSATAGKSYTAPKAVSAGRMPDVLLAAGWREATPLAKLGGPITRELEPEDFDLMSKL